MDNNINQTGGVGLRREVAATIAVFFSFTIVIPVIIFLLEKDEYVRFHAAQSTITFLILIVLQQLVGLIPIRLPIVPLITIFMFIIWLILVYRAWQGDRWEIPIVNKLVGKFIS